MHNNYSLIHKSLYTLILCYKLFSGSSYDANLKPDQVNSLASLTQARSQNVTTKDVSAYCKLHFIN